MYTLFDISSVVYHFKHNAMLYKCCVVDCKSNYDTVDEKPTTFGFPDEVNKEPDLRCRWVRFVNRKDDWSPKNAKIRERNFEPIYI